MVVYDISHITHNSLKISQLSLIQVENFKINDTKTNPITPKIPPISSIKVQNFNNPKIQNENNQSSVVLSKISQKLP